MKKIIVMLAGLLVVAGILLFESDLPAAEVDARYTSESSQFLRLGEDTRIHYRDEGKPNGPVIVLLHGAMASLHTWSPWVQELGDDYRIITVDLPGHGLTGAVAPAFGAEDPMVAAVSAVVDDLAISRFVLGGNSMGGGVTWRFALAYPERVSAMLLVNAVPAPSWPRINAQSAESESSQSAVGFTLLGQSWFRAIARYLDPSWLIRQGLEVAYNRSAVVDDALVDRYYSMIMREGTRAAILARTGRWREPRPAFDLSVLTQPSLVMWGAQDAIIDVAVAEQFEQSLPNTTVVIYEDLGHIPMEEDPQRSAADVRRFMQDNFVDEA